VGELVSPSLPFRKECKEATVETCCNYTGEWAYFSSDEKKWRNKIERLAKEYPDEVQIIRHAEDNDGCVYAKIPASYMKIQPKKRCNMSDEERVALAERLRKSRQKTIDNL
jgi:hypothetical protein